jgi:cytochrome P450
MALHRPRRYKEPGGDVFICQPGAAEPRRRRTSPAAATRVKSVHPQGRRAAWADDIFKVFGWNVVTDEPIILRAWKELESYLDEMVTCRRDARTDDLLSDMMRAEIDGDRLSHDELLTLAATLLMAGTDTARNQLAAAVQVFCDHPDQWAYLAEYPEFAAEAVEEVMR